MKLAIMVSKATPRSVTPARRSTSQSYLMLWPILATAASPMSATSGASAGSVSGGRLATSRRSSMSVGGKCANGRYHASAGATVTARPTMAARIGSSDVAATSSANCPAARARATTASTASGVSAT